METSQLPRKGTCERGRGQFVEVRRGFKFHVGHHGEPRRVLSREWGGGGVRVRVGMLSVVCTACLWDSSLGQGEGG